MNYSIVLLAPSIFGGLAGLAAIAFAWRRGALIDALPSIAWLLLATVPFVYLSVYFSTGTTAVQAWGVAAISLALAAGDAFAAGWRRDTQDLFPSRIGTLVCWALGAAVIVLPVIHIAMAHGLPIIDRLTGNLDPEESAMVRERFSKLLDAPAALKLAFNWVIVIAAPLLAAILFIRRRWMLFGAVVVWCSLYAIVSGARLPLIMFVLFTGIAIINVVRPNLSTFIAGGMAAALLVVVMAGIYRGEVLASWYRDGIDWAIVPDDFKADLAAHLAKTPLQMTPADVERISLPGRLQQKPGSLTDIGDYAAYRAVLSPMEVSNRWYEYYPAVEGQWRPVSDLLPTGKPPEWRHASNKVGVWAYVQRFPASYFDTIHAYASADADAYSFGGLGAVFAAAAVLAFVRGAFGLIGGSGEVGAHLAGLGIAFLTALPFQASVQAILVPQGLIVVLAGALALPFLQRLPALRDRVAVRQGV